MFNDQLAFSGACFTNEIISGTRIKQNDNGVPIQHKRTSEDLLFHRNILHGSVFDAIGLGNGNLLMTLSVVLLRSSTIMSKVASSTTVEADVVSGCSSGRWHRQAQYRWWWW
jgi:hypothetical protein